MAIDVPVEASRQDATELLELLLTERESILLTSSAAFRLSRVNRSIGLEPALHKDRPRDIDILLVSGTWPKKPSGE